MVKNLCSFGREAAAVVMELDEQPNNFASGFSKLPEEVVLKFMRKQRKGRSGRGDKRLWGNYKKITQIEFG